MKRVIIESPFAGPHGSTCVCIDCRLAVKKNIEYARACMRDSLLRGESPFASHLLYTQPGVLRDDDPSERQMGIQAGFDWAPVADARIVYTDRGVSAGMKAGMNNSEVRGQLVIVRSGLPGWRD